MSVEDYYTALRPKFQASWCIHNILTKDLDFFILLSSTSNIVGNRGQAKYNAGNSFQEALARYRVSNGLKATALDLGMILSVGFVAENDSDLVKHRRDVGVEPMRDEEFHAMLDELCNPYLERQSITKSQISLGFQIPEARAAKGDGEPRWMHDPLFSHIHQIRTRGGGGDADGETVNYASQFTAVDSFEPANDIIYDAMVSKLRKALNIKNEGIDPWKPLSGLGVDSHVAIELRT
jgi:hypothetical protein